MQIDKFLENVNSAYTAQDHSALLKAMQEFFSEIYSLTHADANKILGLYSTAQQLETTGMNTQVIKMAIRAHVLSQSVSYPASWRQVKNSLNALLQGDGFPAIP